MGYALQHFRAIEYGYKIEALRSQRDGLAGMNQGLCGWKSPRCAIRIALMRSPQARPAIARTPARSFAWMQPAKLARQSWPAQPRSLWYQRARKTSGFAFGQGTALAVPSSVMKIGASAPEVRGGSPGAAECF